MLTCPIKTSQEYQDILKEANGNEERALELWTERGYNYDADLNEYKETEPSTEIDPEDTRDDKLSALVDRMRLYVSKEIEMFEGRKVKDQEVFKKKKEKLLETLKALDGVDSINMFVKDAYEQALHAKKRFDLILSNIGTEDNKDILNELASINEFANGYSILDEINKQDIYNFFSAGKDEREPGTNMTAQDMLSDTVTIRDNIKKKYVQVGIPIMADWLLQYQAEGIEEKVLPHLEILKNRLAEVQASTNMSDKKKEKEVKALEDAINTWQNFSLDKKSLVDLLTKASQDEGVIDFLISPLISSNDQSLGLFARAVKTELEVARLTDVQIKRLASTEFDKYKDTQSASQNNPAKFNEGLYEFLDFTKEKSDGTVEVTKRAAFVQKHDINKFNTAKKEMYASLAGLSDAEQKRVRNDWYSNNTAAKSQKEIDKIKAAKLKLKNAKLITKEEYEAWLDSVEVIGKKGNVYYKGELSEPSIDYINENWKKLYDSTGKPKNPKGEYHKYLVDMYLEAQERLPDVQKKGYILPSILKTDLERFQQNGGKDLAKYKFKEATSITTDDVDYALGDLSEQGTKFLPVDYTRNMDASEVSLDLVRSVLIFNSMTNKYEALNKIGNEINMFKTIIGEREVTATNSKGKPIFDAFAKKIGFTEFLRQNGESYSKRHVDAFIDMVVYQEMQRTEEILGFSGGKITNTIMGFSAVTTIAADVLKGVANNLQGNIQLIIEASSGEFFSVKNLHTGKKEFAKVVPDLFADFGKSSPKSWVGQLIEEFDPMQGEYKNQYGRNVSQSAVIKLMRTDTLFFNQHWGEYEIQVSSMFALMAATKTIDKATGEEITVLEAYKKYGAEDIYTKTDFTSKQRFDLQNKLHALSKRLHGVYNNFDKGTLQRFSLGRLGLMYKKHLVPGYKRRFKKASMDQELGSPVEGYYRTFNATMLKDIRKMKFNVAKNWATYSDFEKAQITRTLTELSIIITLAGLAAILVYAFSGDDDDDEAVRKSYAYNFAMYELIRMRSETASYIWIGDTMRIIKSPLVITGTIEKTLRLANQLLPTNISETYKRDTGIWEKGDNKAWAYFLKLMGFSGNNIDPGEAVKGFQNLIK
jgi:hypothetical protein